MLYEERQLISDLLTCSISRDINIHQSIFSSIIISPLSHPRGGCLFRTTGVANASLDLVLRDLVSSPEILEVRKKVLLLSFREVICG